VAGLAAAPTAGLAGAALAAGTFTASGSFNLAQIDIALAFVQAELGSPSGSVTLSLNQDSGGVPSAVIESWTGIIVPPQSGRTSSLIQTIHPVSTVPLLAGHPYWIIASPALPNSLLFWNANNVAGEEGLEPSLRLRDSVSSPALPGFNLALSPD
jgi:hypothetical protein